MNTERIFCNRCGTPLEDAEPTMRWFEADGLLFAVCAGCLTHDEGVVVVHELRPAIEGQMAVTVASASRIVAPVKELSADERVPARVREEIGTGWLAAPGLLLG